nr:unnamed protein product [Callosobruchus analis]
MPRSCCVSRYNSNYNKDLKEGLMARFSLVREKSRNYSPCPSNYFSESASYMTVKLPQKRKDPEHRTQELLYRDIQNFDLWMDSDKINPFDDFLSTFKTKDLCDFYFKVYEDSVLFFLIDANNIPNITCSFKVKFILQFPGAYKMLRDTGCLTLPHPIYLSQITADIKTDVGIKQSQIQYLKRKAYNLAPHEKFINILFMKFI